MEASMRCIPFLSTAALVGFAALDSEKLRWQVAPRRSPWEIV
jgi:hypothetical protein